MVSRWSQSGSLWEQVRNLGSLALLASTQESGSASYAPLRLEGSPCGGRPPMVGTTGAVVPSSDRGKVCRNVEVRQDTWLSLVLVPCQASVPSIAGQALSHQRKNPGTSQIPDLLSAEPFLSALTIL